MVYSYTLKHSCARWLTICCGLTVAIFLLTTSSGPMSQPVLAAAPEDLPVARQALALAVEEPAEQRSEWEKRIKMALILFQSNKRGRYSYPDVAAEVLSSFLTHRDVEIRLRAVWGLGNLRGKSVGPPLARALADPIVAVQLEALKWIERVGGGAEAAVPALIEKLTNKNLDMRLAAAKALGQIGWNTQDSGSALPALPILASRLASKYAIEREVAAYNMRLIGSLPSATPKLAVLLSDPERRVRRAALKALGRIGPEARAALPAILATTRDQSAYVRQAAVLTLGDLDQLNENVLASLRRALRDEDWRVRLNAVKSLAILDAAATAEFAVPVLVAVLERETGADQRGKNQFQKQIEQHRDIRLRSDA
ncbi:MAG: HEAT repeat domain-containing protein, partial [Alphaproteobacteria bacterium]|nr:HEAT repeat domain-containing protein [Alphaproteobacteria bacterium]